MLRQKTDSAAVGKALKPLRARLPYFRLLAPLAFSVAIGLSEGCSSSVQHSVQDSSSQIIRVASQKMLNLSKSLVEITRISADKHCLLLGESHDNERMNYIVSKMIPNLKNAGFNHMVFEIDTAYQCFIDEYQSNDSLSKEYLLKNIPLFFRYPKDADLAEACRINGIAILFADNHYEGGRWNDQEMFNYINDKIPEREKFIVDFGSNHTRYSQPDNTMGSLFRAKYGQGCYSVCIQNQGEDIFINLEQEGYLDAKMLDGNLSLRPIYEGSSDYVRISEFDGYLIIKRGD